MSKKLIKAILTLKVVKKKSYLLAQMSVVQS